MLSLEVVPLKGGGSLLHCCQSLLPRPAMCRDRGPARRPPREAVAESHPIAAYNHAHNGRTRDAADSRYNRAEWFAYGREPLIAGVLLNIADIFERNYDTWDRVRIQKQLASKPDIVVLQFGENIPLESFDAAKFKNALRALLTEMKKSSDPEIFMPSFILGSNATVDVKSCVPF